MSVMDKVKETLDLNEDGNLDKQDVERATQIAKEKMAAAKEVAMAAYEKANAEGFFSHFGEYNKQILRPLEHVQDVSVESAKSEILATLVMKPKDPRNGFILWNTIALLLGIVESLAEGLFTGGFISLLWNAGLGYVIAYTLYWAVACSAKKEYMFFSLCFLALYILFNVWMCISTLLFIIPAVLYGAKALVDILQLINAFELYKPVAGDKMML